MVAHLLSGEAKEFHQYISRELSLRHRILPLFERIPPHVTVKPPFETDAAGIGEVERVLRAFAHAEKAPPILFSGFGHFGFRTIYLDVFRSSEAVDLARRAVKTLNENIAWMPQMPREGNKLHASVARFLGRRQFRRIWRALSAMNRLRFEASFDNIAILKKEGKTWGIHAFVPLRSSEKDPDHTVSVFNEGIEDDALLVSWNA